MTTIYNHKAIGDKPVIPNLEFKKMCEWIKNGNTDLTKWTDQYSVVPEQKRLIESLLMEII